MDKKMQRIQVYAFIVVIAALLLEVISTTYFPGYAIFLITNIIEILSVVTIFVVDRMRARFYKGFYYKTLSSIFATGLALIFITRFIVGLLSIQK